VISGGGRGGGLLRTDPKMLLPGLLLALLRPALLLYVSPFLLLVASAALSVVLLSTLPGVVDEVDARGAISEGFLGGKRKRRRASSDTFAAVTLPLPLPLPASLPRAVSEATAEDPDGICATAREFEASSADAVDRELCKGCPSREFVGFESEALDFASGIVVDVTSVPVVTSVDGTGILTRDVIA